VRLSWGVRAWDMVRALLVVDRHDVEGGWAGDGSLCAASMIVGEVKPVQNQ
jgi:hypothetical protein